MMKSYKDVDAYIKDQPAEVQPLLNKLRVTIQKAAPDAEESIGYGMPAYKCDGVLVYFGAFKDHIGFFPTPSGVANFKEELKNYNTAKGTIHFPLDKQLPVKLISDIVKFRVNENREKQELKKMLKTKSKTKK